MEVVHQGDSITHAVIGGKAAIQMKTDNSAHLMHMLSASLYKDQILAVCREVICNAWDAHISCGKTDTPIEITLIEDVLTITDHGNGIPYELMGDIYGTYGGSTKKESTDETGGFGLGCKSPFAYTEHFDVVSTHGGERTIYKITKSSAEIGGKPGIIPISSFPSQESGLTVKIRIKMQDVREFARKIERVVRNGEIKATYNGELMGDLLEFSKATKPWLFTRMDVYPGEDNKIFVRYGNVIYPIDNHEEYEDTYRAALERMSSFVSLRRDRMNIVLLAPSNSLSIAPSRETLSMQEHTIKTIKTLLTQFADNALKVVEPVFKEINRNTVDMLVTAKQTRRLLTRRALPLNQDVWTGRTGTGYKDDETVYDLRELANIYMSNNYPSDSAFWVTDMRYRLRKMIEKKLIDPNMGKSFLKTSYQIGWNYTDKGQNSWFARNISGPLKLKLKEQDLSTNSLFAYDRNDFNWQYAHYREQLSYYETPTMAHRTMRDLLPYLRRIVVLAYGKKNAEGRMKRAIEAAGFSGDHETAQEGVLVYIVNRKKESVEKALKAFEGWNVVNLTQRQSYEVEETEVGIPKERKPRLKGYVALNGMWEYVKAVQPDGSYVGKRGQTVNFKRYLDEDVTKEFRIEKPEFIIQQSMAAGKSSWNSHTVNLLSGLNESQTKAFMKLFGGIGAITNSFPQVQRAKRHDGILPLEDWVHAKLSERIKDATFREAYSNSYHAASRHAYKKGRRHTWDEPVQKELLQLVCATPEIATPLGLTAQLTREDQMLILLLEKYCAFGDTRENAEKNLNLIYPSAAALQLEHWMQNSRLTGLVDITSAKRIIRSSDEDASTIKSVVEFIIHAIKA